MRPNAGRRPIRTTVTTVTDRKIPFLSLKTSNSEYASELTDAARRVIESGWYLHGPETAALEQELLQACGMDANTGHAVGVSNGLDALRLIFRGAIECGMLQPDAEVLVPANTYIASILPITEFGLKPVLVEPDPKTFGIDWHKAIDAVTSRTGALLSVHLYGHPSWDFDIADHMRRRGILLFEDNAQAIGASLTGPDGCRVMTGAMGDAAAFSFYPTKNIGALGDAGAVTTRHEALEKAVRALANYGTDRRYHNIYQGYNCRIDELQAAMLRVKLRHLPAIGQRRRAIAETYLAHIVNPDVTLPCNSGDAHRVWHQFTVMTPWRDEMMRHLERHGIGCDIHYAVPPHLQPCYAGRLGGPYPITERMADRILSLPIADITEADAVYVSEAINDFRTN